MSKLEQAQNLMNELPSWCIIIDKDQKIVGFNQAAKENNAETGMPCFKAVAQRIETCPWCVKTEQIFNTKDLLSGAVELGFKEGEGFVIQEGGLLRDAHWLAVDDNHFLHFGFLGLCSMEEQKMALDKIKNFMGTDNLPEATLESIEKTSKQFFAEN